MSNKRKTLKSIWDYIVNRPKIPTEDYGKAEPIEPLTPVTPKPQPIDPPKPVEVEK